LAKEKRKQENLLDLIPFPCVDWDRHEDGHVVIRQPKSKNRWVLGLVRKLGRSPDTCIHLDEFGSSVWTYIDGKRRVEEIAVCLRKDFGDAVEPVYERLGAFFKILAYQEYIRYRGLTS